MELRPSSSYDLQTLAEIFTRGYENYLLPFEVSEGVLEFMVRTFDLDLDASRVAVRDGEEVGLCNLGVRGDRGWIGGVGVVVAARRQGIARALMEAAHEEARVLGIREMRLEVLVENTGAYALYEDLGYEHVRDVEVWSLEQAEGGTAAEEVSAEAAHARVRALRTAEEPWQRADGTLAHFDDVRGVEVEGGAAVHRSGPQGISLVQIAGDERATHALLTAIRAEGKVNVLNLPADEPAATSLRALGATMVIRQREMRLPL